MMYDDDYDDDDDEAVYMRLKIDYERTSAR
jgi:hypothetical protein